MYLYTYIWTKISIKYHLPERSSEYWSLIEKNQITKKLNNQIANQVRVWVPQHELYCQMILPPHNGAELPV